MTRRFLSLRNKACVMTSLWPLNLYSPHSLMMSHTITSVSCINIHKYMVWARDFLAAFFISKTAVSSNTSLCTMHSPTYLGTGDEPSSEPVVAYDADSRLVSIERDVALPIHQTKDPHCAVFVAHGDMDAIR